MPNITLTFNNPLNTSVQIGDTAYFSNPYPVGGVGSPTGGQWASTVTPHLTNNISEVISLGEITGVTQWNGTNSFIVCEMDQAIFNKYWGDFIPGGCVTVFDPATSTGTCADHIAQYGVAASPQFPNGSGGTRYGSVFKWFYENPSVNFNEPSFHIKTDTPITDGCLVDSSKPGWDPNNYNYWRSFEGFTMSPTGNWQGDINGNPIYSWDSITQTFDMTSEITHDPSVMPLVFIGNDVLTGIPLGFTTNYDPTNGQGYNFQAMLDWVNLNFPGVTNPGMSYGAWCLALAPYGITNTSLPGVESNFTFGTTWPEGSLYGSNGFTESCTSGSFIMFTKDNKVNMSSLLGYYAAVEFKNSSPEKAELFNVGTSFFESSK